MNQYLLGSGLHQTFNNPTLFEWVLNTKKYCNHLYIVSTGHPGVLNYPGLTVVAVNHNIGHIHSMIEKRQEGLSGWSAHVVTLAMIAYCAGKDFLFKESDCFWHGDVPSQLYRELGDAKMVFGKKMETDPFMECSQSTFLILHDFIPKFVSDYLALPDDIEMITENKFVALEQADPQNYARTSCCIDRERPIPFDAPIWSVQQVTEMELKELKSRSLI